MCCNPVAILVFGVMNAIAIIKSVSRSGKSIMSITLDLPPKIEALLRQRAESTGQDISQMALFVLALGLSLDDRDFFEALKGIQRGLDDFEQGEFSSLEEFIAEQNQKYGLSLEA